MNLCNIQPIRGPLSIKTGIQFSAKIPGGGYT